MRDPKEVAIKILNSFIGDPPDTDFQRGYLSAILVFANEVLGVPYNDPTWVAADALVSAKDQPLSEPPKPRWKPRLVS